MPGAYCYASRWASGLNGQGHILAPAGLVVSTVKESNGGAVLIVEVSHVPGALCTPSQAVSPPGTGGASKVSQLGSDAELVLNSVCVVPKLAPFLGNPTPDTNGEGEES